MKNIENKKRKDKCQGMISLDFPNYVLPNQNLIPNSIKLIMVEFLNYYSYNSMS